MGARSSGRFRRVNSSLPSRRATKRPVSDTYGPGDRIAGYRIERQIGRGGMAVVYLA